MKRTLYFFTAEYPYGNVSETFIENEINYLAKSFDHIIIFPSEKPNNHLRSLPNNVQVNDLFICKKGNFKKVFFRNIFTLLPVFLNESLKQNNFKFYVKNWKYYFDFLSRQYSKYLLLERYLNINGISNKDVFYDFWYINTAPALSFLKRKGYDIRTIVRAHRYDLYDEEWKEGKVPFRNFIFEYADFSVFSNTHGLNYFKKKLYLESEEKLSVNYLGVNSFSNSTEKLTVNKDFTIVSCSGISERKRVTIIPEVLNELKQNITWIHFGEGIQKEALLKLCKNLPVNINWEIKGHVDNTEVIDFYRKNKVDLFISFTLSEGLPVSFKEIQSFGVPIFSTDVCGIPDLVNERTGVLIKTDEPKKNIVEKLNNVIDNYPFNRNTIKQFFTKNFLAEKVYPEFINKVLLGIDDQEKD